MIQSDSCPQWQRCCSASNISWVTVLPILSSVIEQNVYRLRGLSFILQVFCFSYEYDSNTLIIKGIVQRKLKSHTCTAHPDVDGGPADDTTWTVFAIRSSPPWLEMMMFTAKILSRAVFMWLPRVLPSWNSRMVIWSRKWVNCLSELSL